MSESSLPLPPDSGRARPVFLRWALTSAFAGTATIVAHELGHYLAGRAVGLPDLVLRHASVSHPAYGPDLHTDQAVMTGGGMFLSWALVLVCCLLARRHGDKPLVIATGVASLLKSLPMPLALVAWLSGEGGATNMDEHVFAELLGWSPVTMTIAGSAIVLGGLLWLIPKLRARPRGAAIVGLLLGLSAGITSWLFVIGPWLMP